AGQLRALSRRRRRLDRWQRQAQHLDVVIEPIQNAKARVQVDEGGNGGHTLLHVKAGRRRRQDGVKVAFGENVGGNVNSCHRSSPIFSVSTESTLVRPRR